MGTEGSRALERQLQALWHLLRHGAEQQGRSVFPLVLWLAPDDQRAEAITGSVQRLPSTRRELFRVARFTEPLTVILGTNNGE